MKNFTLRIPRIYFGKGSIEKIKQEAEIIGEKTLIVTGKNSAKISGALDDLTKILKSLGIEYKIYDKISQNPTVSSVDGVKEIISDFSPSSVIGVGGGSSMDSAKGISVILKNGGSIWDYISDGVKKPKKIKSALPIVCIPTLSASGSEADGGAVFTNEKTKEKIPLGSVYIIPKFSIVDPTYTMSVPKRYTGFGGIDVFVHIMEPFLSSPEDSSDSADLISAGYLKTLLKWLPVAINEPENYRARAEVMWVSTMALSGIPTAGRRGNLILHYIEHPVSGHFNVVHGEGLSALLLAYIEELKNILPDRVEKFFNLVFNRSMDNGLSELEKFLKENGLFLGLRELGVKREDFSKIADDSIRIYGRGKNYLGGIEKVNKDFIIRVLEKSF